MNKVSCYDIQIKILITALKLLAVDSAEVSEFWTVTTATKKSSARKTLTSKQISLLRMLREQLETE